MIIYKNVIITFSIDDCIFGDEKTSHIIFTLNYANRISKIWFQYFFYDFAVKRFLKDNKI